MTPPPPDPSPEASRSSRGSAAHRPTRSLAVKLTVVGVVMVVLLEAGIRWRQWMRYGTTEGYYQFVEHTESGLLIPEPGLEVGPIRINSLGFRGPEIEIPKPDGRVRLAFLGGSTTFCAEASSNEDVWPHLVVAGLRERFPDTSFDYVNGACAGYSTIQSSLNLTHRIAPLEPDVLVVYHGTNDLTHDSRIAAAAEGRYDLDAKEDSFLAQHWLTWALVEKNVRFLMRRESARDDGDPFRPDYALVSAPFRERLSALLDECNAVAPVVVVPTFRQRTRREQSLEEQLAASSSSLYYMPFMNPAALIDGFAHYNDVLREVVREKGGVLVDGELDVPGDAAHFRDSVHFTDEGCRVMAESVLAELVESPAFAALVAARD